MIWCICLLCMHTFTTMVIMFECRVIYTAANRCAAHYLCIYPSIPPTNQSNNHPTIPWWRHHQMETFSAFLAGEFSAQRPVTRSFDVFSDLRLNKRLSKQSWGWWFETLSRRLWRHRNAVNQSIRRPIYLFWNAFICLAILPSIYPVGAEPTKTI